MKNNQVFNIMTTDVMTFAQSCQLILLSFLNSCLLECNLDIRFCGHSSHLAGQIQKKNDQYKLLL